jgi:excisionase family DNA binding protein
MEKISIVRRRLEASPTRAELRARQRMENPSPETLSGGSAISTSTLPAQQISTGPAQSFSVDLGPEVMDELWTDGSLAETASGRRHFIVEAERGRDSGMVVLKLEFMKPDYYLRLLTTEEVCEMLHISRSTLYTFVHTQELKTYRMGRGLRFRFQDVLDFLTNCQTGSD